jgi:hypothetical protein
VTNTTVVRAARAEKKAEDGREAAETAWRAAWWKTTSALAKVPGAPRTELTKVYREVQLVLGQGTEWLSKRRKTGKAFVSLKANEINALPPRKAIEVAVNNVPVTDEIIEMLRDSDELRIRDKAYPTRETLRDFSARLTGTTWSVGSDEEIEKALEAKPELARKITAKTIETDETAAKAAVEVVAKSQPEAVGRAVAKNVEATASYADVRRAETEEKREKLAVKPTEPTPETQAMDAKVSSRNAVSEWLDLVHLAAVKLREATQHWEEIEADLITEDLTEVNASLVEAEGDAVILRQRVSDKNMSLTT